MDRLKGRVIAIEGAPGVGKSTLLPKMAGYFKNHGLTPVTYEERYFRVLLDKSRHDTSFTFANQTSMTMRRVGILSGFAQLRTTFPDLLCIIDRSLHGDQCFVKYLYGLGCITEEQYALYWAMMKEKQDEIDMIDYTIYLHAKAETAFERSRTLRGREEDAILPLEYFRDLERIHFDRFFTDPKTIVCDWSDFNQTRYDNLPDRVSIIEEAPPVIFSNWSKHSGKEPGDYIVQSLKDLYFQPNYRKIYCTTDVVEAARQDDHARDVMMRYRSCDCQVVIA